MKEQKNDLQATRTGLPGGRFALSASEPFDNGILGLFLLLLDQVVLRQFLPASSPTPAG